MTEAARTLPPTHHECRADEIDGLHESVAGFAAQLDAHQASIHQRIDRVEIQQHADFIALRDEIRTRAASTDKQINERFTVIEGMLRAALALRAEHDTVRDTEPPPPPAGDVL